MAAVAHQPGEAPFHEETIVAYAKAARALAAWMTAEKIDGDFTACRRRGRRWPRCGQHRYTVAIDIDASNLA